MTMKTGLRTEIVISTVLLLAAALLFAGFLLVKLSERELLDERRSSLLRTARLIAASDIAPSALASLLRPLTQDGELVAWRLLDSNLSPLMSYALVDATLSEGMPPAPLEPGEIGESLSYSSSWNPFGVAPDNFLDLALRTGDPSGNVLQLRFSLTSLVGRVHRGQRLVLGYVILYGAVLSLFGIYLLNRNIVDPVRRLQVATAGVTAGDLAPIDIGSGPGEIRELADDFNSMIRALQASRAETAAHIHSLEETNLALQEARDEVVRAEKLASVGHLAAGMAHEIGNPLAAVIGYLNLIRDEIVDLAQRDMVERSLFEVGRIDRLVRDLLDYAAPVRSAAEPFDPVETLHEAVALLANQGAFEKVQVNDQAQAGLGSVCMDRSRFLQICVNLLINARDAMPDGGTLKLGANRRGEELVLSFADTGQGMVPDVLRRIFEPFFTTKDPGKGRGLGLAVCQRLLAEVGGHLDVESMPGQGSVFTVRLPAKEEV